MESFVHGVILAIGLILPLGVQNLFVFNQGSIQPSFIRAVPVIITASVCDTLLIILAVQGVSLFVLKFSMFKVLLIGAGSVFLFYMGWLSWNSGSVQQSDVSSQIFTTKQQIVFAATVSLLNPHAVLDTIGVIGTSSVNYQGSDRLLFTLACILVSWIWFFSLAGLGRLFGRQRRFADGIVLINKVSAVFMWGSALYMSYSSI